MHFVTRASSEEDFRKWIDTARETSQFLNWEGYKKLALPSENSPIELYQLKLSDLFQKIIMKYMHPRAE